MGHASKDAINPHFGSKYADLAAIIEAVRKPLTNNGLSFVQLTEGSDTGVTVTTRLLHVSGESVSSSLWLPVAQKTPQAYGSALTYAKRYSLSALVGIAADVDDDGNAASGPRDSAPVVNAPAAKAALDAARAAHPKRTPPRQPSASERNEPPPLTDSDAPGDHDTLPSYDPENDGRLEASHDRRQSFGFGREKGVALESISDAGLGWYLSCLERDLADATKAKWHGKTRKQISDVLAEKTHRGAERI